MARPSERGSAKAAVLWDGADWQALGLEGALFAPRARLAIAAVSEVFAHPPDIEAGIHPSAVVAPDAEIGPGAFIGPLAVIGAGVTLGANARIAAHASIGAQARIGADALIHSGARIGARVTIGARAIIHPNAVIGADGFSFVTPEPGSVEAAKQGSAVTEQRNTELRRIHSLAAVTLGDDVEIGAGATIDRGTIADTQIGSGTKIDNLVQIGHNVRVGALCLICAQVRRRRQHDGSATGWSSAGARASPTMSRSAMTWWSLRPPASPAMWPREAS